MKTLGVIMGLGFSILAGNPVLARQHSQKSTSPVSVVDSTVRFSALDGGESDLDGAADGVLTVQAFRVTGTGLLVLDVPRAVIAAHGDVVLEAEGRIGHRGGRNPVNGPNLVIRSDGSIRIVEDAAILVDGQRSGGSMFLCALTALDVLDRASLSANGRQSAGSISLNSTGPVMLGTGIRLTAIGGYGGQIAVRSCDSARNAVVVSGGKVEAFGSDELGGQITLEATAGGIAFSGTPPESPIFAADGVGQPGRVDISGALGIDRVFKALATPRPSLEQTAQPFVTCGCPSFAPVLEVDPPSSPTMAAQVEITGRASALGQVVRIEATADTEEVISGADRRFSAMIDLAPNQLNNVFVSEVEQGVPGPHVGVGLIQDSQGPSLFIDFPADGDELTIEATDVAGRVGDMLSGFMGLAVSVNGVAATVDVGVGNNGTFLARNVPLNMGGPTSLVATATDAVGNTESTPPTSVSFQPIPAGAPYMVALGGNGQSARIGNRLPDPLRVQVFDGNNHPLANKLVTFHVSRSNGRLSDGAQGGSMTFQDFTDGSGIVEALWTLGSDAGFGNNRVEVNSMQVAGTVCFCASATPGPAAQINIGSGGNQIAEFGGMAPLPLRAWVSDSCNGIEGVPVRFRVVRGVGNIDGQLQRTVFTSTTGHAEVPFQLGDFPGLSLIEADFAGNAHAPATFVVQGVARNERQPTAFKGLVLDNGSNPVQGATCTLELNGVTFGPELTNGDGQFLFDNLPIAGPGHLHIDGLTATHVGGLSIPPNTFPGLAYLVVVIPNVDNSLPMGAVLLPRLNPNNERLYDADPMGQPTVLEVEGVEGLQMIVAPGSMKLHGVPAPSGTKIFLNQVNHDDVPMPMPDGVASPFAWTLQPAGATFDPPARILYPNMTGLPAGALAYFLNFNHDTGRFEIVGSGRVSEDASVIRSDAGVGIAVAGWGGSCPPYSVTEDCKKCNVKTSGPSIVVGTPTTYTASISGNGLLTWTAIDGQETVDLGTFAVSDGAVATTTYTFQTGGPSSRIEARLECTDPTIEDPTSDQDGVGSGGSPRVQLCFFEPVPPGYIRVFWRWDPVQCPFPTGLECTEFDAVRYDDLPVGSVLDVSIFEPAPPGWRDRGTHYWPWHCNTHFFGDNMKRISREQ